MGRTQYSCFSQLQLYKVAVKLPILQMMKLRPFSEKVPRLGLDFYTFPIQSVVTTSYTWLIQVEVAVHIKYTLDF